ncbi:hypothetical protein [Streptomyces sp. P17]|uniref:hypothetical protein n=1 Tax=Streptomyces sp. P17 TaxID=3074716 RepID=UPI0028F45A24|nr:hypothetical protein [Streptomyces sp. P17]MDT9698079.1 hypothetical protein [Streptomyces sp. P17]
MGRRTQHTAREARWTTRIAGLCAALAALLAALVICLGPVAHGQSAQATASMATMSAAAAPTDIPAEHHTTTAAPPSDCPSGDDVCCRPAADGVRALLAAPAQPLTAILPRVADLPRQPDTPAQSTGPAPVCLAPDLHVLQVQRT